jgi:hypothetical protein
VSKHAHIYNDRQAQLGDRVLGLCGKEFKIKVVLWSDLPRDYPICRDCVDTALKMAKEADGLIDVARRSVRRMSIITEVLLEELNTETMLDVHAETDLAFRDELAMRNALKAEKKRRKHACTCTWKNAAASGQPRRTTDPECPVHGGELDAIGVEVPEIEEPK